MAEEASLNINVSWLVDLNLTVGIHPVQVARLAMHRPYRQQVCVALNFVRRLYQSINQSINQHLFI